MNIDAPTAFWNVDECIFYSSVEILDCEFVLDGLQSLGTTSTVKLG